MINKMCRSKKFKEFKVQGIRDYDAICVWDKLKIGDKLELELKIVKDNDFIRTDNPNKRANESIAVVYKDTDSDCQIIGFVPDDDIHGIYEYLEQGHNGLYECKVLSKIGSDNIESLTVRVDILPPPKG